MEGPSTPAGIRAGSDKKHFEGITQGSSLPRDQAPGAAPNRTCVSPYIRLVTNLTCWPCADGTYLPPCCPCLSSKVRTLVWTDKQGKQQRETRWGTWLSSEKQGKWTEKTKRKSTNQTDRQHGRRGSWSWRNPAARQRENLPHFSKITLVSSLRAVQEMSDHFFYSVLDRRFWQEKDRSFKQEGGVIITLQVQVSPWEDLRASEQSYKMEHFHHRFKLDSKPIPTKKSK